MIIYGYDILESQLVVAITAVIPLGISLGLVSIFFPQIAIGYLLFALVGFFAILITRYQASTRIATFVLAAIHGISGLIIFLFPIIFVFTDVAPVSFLLVSLGGAFIGVGGLALAFLKSGKPILPAEQIFKFLPWLLFLMTLSLTVGVGLS